jgi:Zn finger protein HypA/HybF involved in hydrogenase expression
MEEGKVMEMKMKMSCQDCLWYGPEDQVRHQPVTLTTGYDVNDAPVEMQSFELRCPICGGVNVQAEDNYNAIYDSEEQTITGNDGKALQQVDLDKLLRDTGASGDKALGGINSLLEVYQTPGSIFEAICMYYGLPPSRPGHLLVTVIWGFGSRTQPKREILQYRS